MRGPLVISAAANGYAHLYRWCLDSHRAYAERSGFAYRLVVPRRVISPRDAGWLKIALLRRAVERHEWALWLDADTEVMPRCPDFRTVEEPGRAIYMAHGHTGRLNSGVVACRSGEQARDWLDLLMARADVEVPPEDWAPYENGHVIHYGKDQPFIGLLDARWNQMGAHTDGDYIRHHTGEKMWHTLRGRMTRIVGAAAGALAR